MICGKGKTLKNMPRQDSHKKCNAEAIELTILPILYLLGISIIGYFLFNE